MCFNLGFFLFKSRYVLGCDDENVALKKNINVSFNGWAEADIEFLLGEVKGKVIVFIIECSLKCTIKIVIGA